MNVFFYIIIKSNLDKTLVSTAKGVYVTQKISILNRTKLEKWNGSLARVS